MVERESVVKETKKIFLSNLLSAFSAFVGSLVVVTVVVSLFHKEPKKEVHNVQLENDLRDTRAGMLQLKAEVKDLSESIQNISKLPDGTKLSIKLQQIIRSIADIQNREEVLRR